MDNNWIVVIRKVRGEEGQRGLIVTNLLTEAAARDKAKQMKQREDMRGFNVWPMPEEDY